MKGVKNAKDSSSQLRNKKYNKFLNKKEEKKPINKALDYFIENQKKKNNQEQSKQEDENIGLNEIEDLKNDVIQATIESTRLANTISKKTIDLYKEYKSENASKTDKEAVNLDTINSNKVYASYQKSSVDDIVRKNKISSSHNKQIYKTNESKEGIFKKEKQQGEKVFCKNKSKNDFESKTTTKKAGNTSEKISSTAAESSSVASNTASSSAGGALSILATSKKMINEEKNLWMQTLSNKESEAGNVEKHFLKQTGNILKEIFSQVINWLLKLLGSVCAPAVIICLVLFVLIIIVIIVILVVVMLSSFYYLSGNKNNTTDINYFSNRLNAYYDDYDTDIRNWRKKNKTYEEYTINYIDNCKRVDNFSDCMNLYFTYMVNSGESMIQESESETTNPNITAYLYIDTQLEEENLKKAFDTMNYKGVNNNNEKQLDVHKKTYENIKTSLSSEENSIYNALAEIMQVGLNSGYVYDKRETELITEDTAKERSPLGTLPQSYSDLRNTFTWMNENCSYPVKDVDRAVTSQYTLWRTDVDSDHPSHYGVDFKAPDNSTLVAIADAVVYDAITSDTGYGNHIILQFNDGTYAVYAHMNRFEVEKGDTVKNGDVIGYSGNTGDSFGAHLHLVLQTSPGGMENQSRYDFNAFVNEVWTKFYYYYEYED